MLRLVRPLILLLALLPLAACGNGESTSPADSETVTEPDSSADSIEEVSPSDSQDLAATEIDSVVGDVAPDQYEEDQTDTLDAPDSADIEAPIVPGALIVTEFMADPGISGGAYEWIEFYNTTGEWLTLSSCTLRDDGGESTVLGAGALVPPKGYVVLAYLGTASSWLGVDPVGYYSDLTLENTGDEIVLECRGALIDKVSYGPGQVVKLASRQLVPTALSGSANDEPTNWCEGYQPFGDGEGLGTPGLANPQCQTGPNPCEPNPCLTPPNPACDSQNAVVLSFTGPGECRLVGESYACDYMPHVEDCKSNGQICQNAECITILNPCNPDPCTVPPGDFCQPDLKTLVHYQGAGSCTEVDGQAECAFNFWYEDCSEQGKECKAAKCVDIVVEAKPTNAGDVIISEFMAQAGPEPDYGEWIELYNTTNTALNLKSCALIDMSGQAHTFFGNLVIEANGYLVLARSDDPTKNYGLQPDYVYSGFLLDNGSDYIILKCGLKKIDELFYQSAFITEQHSTQLDPDLFDFVSNDLATSWCASQFTYGTAGRFGSPGEPNPDCALVVEPVDWCKLLAPTNLKVLPGTPVLYSAVIEEAGITDESVFLDAPGPLRAEVGIGPLDSDPVDNASWTWHVAGGNPVWNGLTMDLPNADQYILQTVAPELGYYDVAFRFSADEGVTWTYCDASDGEGTSGSQDGYSVSGAGKLYVVETLDPCVPNPCTNPPAGVCQPDGKWLIYSISPGECTSQGEGTQPQCTYATAALNCNLNGQICVDGECVIP